MGQIQAWLSKINTNSLKAGDRFYDFNSLAKALGINTSKRIKKEPILNELYRFVDFQKVGSGFVIKRIREVPFHKKAPRQYQELIQVLIHALLAGTEELMIETTYKQLFVDIAMANPNYKYIYDKDTYGMMRKDLDNKDLFVPSKEVFDEFKRSVGWSMKDKIISALNYMKDQQLVLWEEGLWICHDRLFYNEPIEKGEKRYVHAEATKYEKDMYLSARRHILVDEFHADTLKEIYKKHKSLQYKEQVDKYMHENYGWLYAYNKLKIWYNYEDLRVSLQAAIDSLLEEAAQNDIEVKKDKLNSMVKEMILGRGRAIYKNANNKIKGYEGGEWGNVPNKLVPYTYLGNDSAKIAWEVLTGYFISKDSDMSALAGLKPESQYEDIDDDINFDFI